MILALRALAMASLLAVGVVARDDTKPPVKPVPGTIYLAAPGERQKLAQRDGMTAEGSRWQIHALDPNTLEASIVFTLPNTPLFDRQDGLGPGEGLYLRVTDAQPSVPGGIQVAPDGKSVAMFYRRWVQIQPFDGGPAVQLLELNQKSLASVALSWTTTGKELLVEAADYFPKEKAGARMRRRLFRCAADGSRSEELKLEEPLGARTRTLDRSADGKLRLEQTIGEKGIITLALREDDSKVSKLVSLAGHELRSGDQVRLAPDGQRLAFSVIAPKGKSGVFLADVGENAAAALVHPLELPKGSFSPSQKLAWSPDGRHLVLRNRIESVNMDKREEPESRQAWKDELLILDLDKRTSRSVDLSQFRGTPSLLAWW